MNSLFQSISWTFALYVDITCAILVQAISARGKHNGSTVAIIAYNLVLYLSFIYSIDNFYSQFIHSVLTIYSQFIEFIIML